MTAELKAPPDAIRLPWWMSPAGAHFGLLLPLFILIVEAGGSSYSGLTIRTVHYLTPYYVLIGSCALVVTGLGGWIGAEVRLGRLDTSARRTADWSRAALLVGGLAILAYAVWFRNFFLDPLLLLRTVLGTYRPDRTNLELTTGITSFSNVAPVFFSIYAYQALTQRAGMPGSMHLMCGVLACLTLFRVYAWSERLAMIEAVVPFALAGVARLSQGRSPLTRSIAALGPLLALPLLILYFALFEYVRSWQYGVYNRHYDFWEFATGRLASYYYTALNNGAGILETSDWPSLQFENVLNWLHKAPIIGPMFSHAVQLHDLQLNVFLNKFADPEFNNPSGVFAVFYDLGLPLGFCYFFVVGLLGGAMYRAYRAGQLRGVLFYPMFFIAFLEVYRYPYLGASRAFVWAIGIGLALLVGVSHSRRQPYAHRPEANNQRPRSLGSA